MSQLRRTFSRVYFEPQGLGSVSWEDRRKLTPAQLIELMGALHVNHPYYTARKRSLLPLPNLAGRQPVIEVEDVSFLGLCRNALRWFAR